MTRGLDLLNGLRIIIKICLSRGEVYSSRSIITTTSPRRDVNLSGFRENPDFPHIPLNAQQGVHVLRGAAPPSSFVLFCFRSIEPPAASRGEE